MQMQKELQNTIFFVSHAKQFSKVDSPVFCEKNRNPYFINTNVEGITGSLPYFCVNLGRGANSLLDWLKNWGLWNEFLLKLGSHQELKI